MRPTYYSQKKVLDMFASKDMKYYLSELEESGQIPKSEKYRSGAIFQNGWKEEDLPLIAEKIGFFKRFDLPVSLSVFTTKGGVLKSTLALNLARVAALHNVKTCVVGLDMQCDITSALGHEYEAPDDSNLNELIENMDSTKGLFDFFNGKIGLNEIILPTDLEKLYLIPETPELVALNESLSNINRREYWLDERVITPLKEYFDLIIMDCSPNWNKLTTNALVASDVLISPLECKINNFRNFKVFSHFLSEIKNEMKIDFESIFVPTRYSANRKLGLEIKEWYENNVSHCTSHGLRESQAGEEATALNLSILEHASNKDVVQELKALLTEIHTRIFGRIDDKTSKLLNGCLKSNHDREQTNSMYS